MRTSDGVTHIHGDHLGSATNTTGPNAATQRYFPWGARRSTTELPTPYRFTGQREESTIGLYFYNARWYDPALGRFTQPDTLVPEPGNPQALNRYAYTLNNPLRYTDPSGHCPWCVAGKVLLQTAVDVGIDYLIARATGTDFNLASSLKVNALVNVTTLGIGSTVSKLRHLGKLATLTATHADDALKIGAKVAAGELAEEAAERAGKEIAQEAAEEGFKNFTARNFRENLMRLTGKSPNEVAGLEAHHVLPQALEKDFQKLGIENIQDPKFGSWVEPGAHRRWSYEYNEKWKAFLKDSPSPDDILNFARQLAEKYKFDVHFR